MPTRVAKLFRNGRSQAVRLPAEFRFKAKEVFIRKDEQTGDVILSERRGSWEEAGSYRLSGAVSGGMRIKHLPGGAVLHIEPARPAD